MGERERAPEGVAAEPEGALAYRLAPEAAARRALVMGAVRALATLAPVVLAVVLLESLGWAVNAAFWGVVAALVALVVVRAVVGYAGARRKLTALIVTVSDDAIRVQTSREDYAVARTNVARIVEVDGALGGVSVESHPDPRTEIVYVANVPRGGEGYAQVRARLETWRPVERRRRRGRVVRVAVGVAVVAGIFFVPFLRDDFVARSKMAAAAVVVGTWLVMRSAVRGR